MSLVDNHELEVGYLESFLEFLHPLRPAESLPSCDDTGLVSKLDPPYSEVQLTRDFEPELSRSHARNLSGPFLQTRRGSFHSPVQPAPHY
jgi:hypothetical protein